MSISGLPKVIFLAVAEAEGEAEEDLDWRRAVTAVFRKTCGNSGNVVVLLMVLARIYSEKVSHCRELFKSQSVVLGVSRWQ